MGNTAFRAPAQAVFVTAIAAVDFVPKYWSNVPAARI